MAGIGTQSSSSNNDFVDEPVPLSFPAILRNPNITSRFAHLHPPDRNDKPHVPSPTIKRKSRRDENEGKRWIRRKENARFVGNPYVVLASKIDYTLQPPALKTTFPEPLPPYLHRNTKLPPASAPSCDPNSANAGRFSLSLKGMRRDLRKSGLKARSLVRDVEEEIVVWLREGGTVLSPDTDANRDDLDLPGTPVGTTDSIRQVSRTPLKLIWSINDDAFARYVVHCCARYHEIVSLSKHTSGQRLTYLLRPNTFRPDFHAAAGLYTPPVTDLEYSSQVETESDLFSSEAGESDVEPVARSSLSAISEHPTPPPPDPVDAIQNKSPPAISDADDISASLSSLTFQDDPDRTFRPEPRIRQSIMRTRMLARHQRRPSSSPSRSPVRRRTLPRVAVPRTSQSRPRSFFEYLFA